MPMRDADGPEQWCEFAGRVEVTSTQRDRTTVMADQMAGRRTNAGQPVRHILRIADGGREQ